MTCTWTVKVLRKHPQDDMPHWSGEYSGENVWRVLLAVIRNKWKGLPVAVEWR